MPTTEQFVAAVRAIAAEKPDHVYTKPEGYEGICLYRHAVAVVDNENYAWRLEFQPGCIIGHAFARLGLQLPCEATNGADNIANETGDDKHTAGIEWCGVVQRNQDRQHSWGEAVALADRALIDAAIGGRLGIVL